MPLRSLPEILCHHLGMSGCSPVFRVFFLGIFFIKPYSANATDVYSWMRVTAPTTGRSESIGGYAAGCLRGGKALESQGAGFQIMNPDRNHRFGNESLLRFLRELGAELKLKENESISIGDLALPRGGPSLDAHASHQSGLDVDIWYKSREVLESAKNTDPFRPESLVVFPDRIVNREKFGEREIELLKRVAGKSEVDRIFVNYAIKQELCTKRPNADWLKKVRPWYSHDAHFHVRLKCPALDTQCKPMSDLPEGNGCDASLRAWWSPRVRKEEALAAHWAASGETPEWKMPSLPQECAPVIAEKSSTGVRKFASFLGNESQ